MAEEVIRKNFEHGFTVMGNKAMQDEELSLRDLGLLVKMFSLPDDWQYSVNGLNAISNKDGRDAIRNSLKQLEKLGYLKRTQLRNERGQLTTNIYDFYDHRHFETPLTDLPSSDFQSTVNTGQTQSFTSSEPLTDFQSTDYAGQTQTITSSQPLTGLPLTANPTQYNKYKHSNKLNEFNSLGAQAQNTSSDNILAGQRVDLENTSSNDVLPVQTIDPSKIDVVPVKHDIALNPCGVPSIEDISAHVLRKKMKLDNYDICMFIDYYNKANWVTASGEPLNWMHKLTSWETKKLEREQEREEQKWLMEERERQIAENAMKVAETLEEKRKEQWENMPLKGDVPTTEKVSAFIKDEAIKNVDAEEFLRHYDATHWLDGNGKLITDWRSKIREWDARKATEKCERKTSSSSLKREQAEPDRATLDEVRAYVAERGLENFDCDKFFNYYENLDWHTPYGKPVVSWKNQVESWDSRDKTQVKAIEKTAQVAGSWEQSKEREKALDELQLLKDNLEFFNRDNEQDRKSRENINSQINELKEKWGIE